MDLTGRPKTNSFFGKSAGATLPEPVVQPTPQSSNVTTILKGMRIEGSILAQEDMYVDNEVNGPITSNSKVTVGPSATIHGEIKAREIVIMGRVIGNVEATEKVALCDGADLRGDITTFLISMEEKAYLEGKIDCRPAPPAKVLPPARSSDSRARTAPVLIRASLSA